MFVRPIKNLRVPCFSCFPNRRLNISLNPFPKQGTSLASACEVRNHTHTHLKENQRTTAQKPPRSPSPGFLNVPACYQMFRKVGQSFVWTL